MAITPWLTAYASTIDSSSFSVSSTMIDFNDVTGGNCNLCGPAITTQYAHLGVIFNNPTFPQATVDTNLTYGIPNATGPNALYVAQGGHYDDPPAMPFQILFSNPVSLVGFDFASSLDSFLQVDAYGANGAYLETLSFMGQPTSTGLGGFAGIEESAPIYQLDVSYHPNTEPNRTFNFSLADLQFQANASVASPEPSTTALVAIGVVGVLIGVLRSRRPRRR